MKIDKKIISVLVGMITIVVLFSLTTAAQGTQSKPDLVIDNKNRTEIIEGALKLLSDNYVFPEVAEKMNKSLRERMAKNEYDGITNPKTLADTLTSHLREVSQDKHIRISYNYQAFPIETEQPETDEKREERRQAGQLSNFGFQKVERMHGNVGYLDIFGFFSTDFASETAVASMNFLSNSSALIIDLRRNDGGHPSMVALLTSYLFDDQPVHLNDIYRRQTNKTQQWWTLPYVPGKRLGSQHPVYILTSKNTFSAAEEFAYNLKNLKRAIIVGETTRGGANPGGRRRINDSFAINIPNARSVNPVTGTNWEGAGIEPDIKVPAVQALETAHLEAIKKLVEITKNPQRVEQLKKLYEALQKEYSDSKK